MTAIWPAALPQYVQEQGFGEGLPDQTIESQMEAGLPKSRRRYTKNFRPMQATIWCTAEQGQLFEYFYEETLSGGVLPFHWVNPFTQVLAEFRFKRPPPQKRSFGSANVEISMNLWQTRQYAALRFDSTRITFDSTLVTFDETNRF